MLVEITLQIYGYVLVLTIGILAVSSVEKFEFHFYIYKNHSSMHVGYLLAYIHFQHVEDNYHHAYLQ